MAALSRLSDDLIRTIIFYSDLALYAGEGPCSLATLARTNLELRDAVRRLSPRLGHDLVARSYPLLSTVMPELRAAGALPPPDALLRTHRATLTGRPEEINGPFVVPRMNEYVFSIEIEGSGPLEGGRWGHFRSRHVGTSSLAPVRWGAHLIHFDVPHELWAECWGDGPDAGEWSGATRRHPDDPPRKTLWKAKIMVMRRTDFRRCLLFSSEGDHRGADGVVFFHGSSQEDYIPVQRNIWWAEGSELCRDQNGYGDWKQRPCLHVKWLKRHRTGPLPAGSPEEKAFVQTGPSVVEVNFAWREVDQPARSYPMSRPCSEQVLKWWCAWDE